MNKIHFKTLAAGVTLLFVFAPLAHAAISVGGSGVVDVDGDGLMESKTKANIGVTTTGTETKAGAEAETGVMMEGGAQMQGERGMERAEAEANMHAESGLEIANMHINVRALMKEEGEHEGTDAEVDTAAKVHSAVDFEHFVAHKAKADANLKEVEVDDDTVVVKYKTPAKLFGFISTTVTTEVTADAKGKVEVDYPWYHIFMKKHASKASMQSIIAHAVAGERKGLMEGMSTTTIQGTIEAELGIPDLFDTLVYTLKRVSAKTSAQVEAEAAASVGAQ